MAYKVVLPKPTITTLRSILTRTLGDKKIAHQAVNATIEAFRDLLTGRGKIKLPGFGTFEMRDMAARTGRNPQTGQPVSLPAHKKAGYRMSKTWKRVVNNWAKPQPKPPEPVPEPELEQEPVYDNSSPPYYMQAPFDDSVAYLHEKWADVIIVRNACLRTIVPANMIRKASNSDEFNRIMVKFHHPFATPCSFQKAFIGYCDLNNNAEAESLLRKRGRNSRAALLPEKPYSFTDTPVQLFFEGNEGATIVNYDLLSDLLEFDLDGTRDIMVSLYFEGETAVAIDNSQGDTVSFISNEESNPDDATLATPAGEYARYDGYCVLLGGVHRTRYHAPNEAM